MQKSPLRVFVGVITMVLLGITMAKGYESYQVSSAKALTSENWGLGFSTEGEAPTANETPEELKQWGAYYIGNQNEKKIYLTFDCGYENGNMESILDALKQADVKAAFFLVGNYLETEPELVKRMAEEGHIIGNHTYHHKDMSGLGEEEFKKELTDFEVKLKQITGKECDMFYRPPQGKYSTRSLQMAKNAGYKTIFWSLAYVDWYDDNQPTKEEAFSKLLKRIHPGAIVLLHSTSKTNGEILPELLQKWKDMGYTFGSLQEL
ncbi:MAG: polysaccharide deacetylase family protein [Lachnospiraceae bacterium]|nr:polysaccharide deacetylase family protein [Lachnospiraceae bacterium]